MANVEIRIAVFLRGISEIAEVPAVLRSEVGVRCDVQGMGPGVRGKECEPARKAFLNPGLQRVVIRKARRAEPANESVDLGQWASGRKRQIRIGIRRRLVAVEIDVLLQAPRSCISDFKYSIRRQLVLR